jgi:rare lipoprotein A (peptidoglycan hydrolase)
MPDSSRHATRLLRPFAGTMLAFAVACSWAFASASPDVPEAAPATEPMEQGAESEVPPAGPAPTPEALAQPEEASSVTDALPGLPDPGALAEDPSPVLAPLATLAGTVDPSGLYVETGEASWYGHDFAGRTTASGERFDMQALTVAHPSLPLGSVVEIRNLENGRRTLARINDRGPFVRDRIVDCSLAVARTLGFVGKGLAHVQLTVLEAPVHVPAVLWRHLHAPAAVERHARSSARREAAPIAPAVPATPSLVATTLPAPEPAVLRTAGDMVTRRASVLPFPALVHASRWLQRVLVGPCVDEKPRRVARDPFESAALRRFVALFQR